MSIEKIKSELAATAGYKRLEALFDEGSFSPIAPFAASVDGPAEASAGFGEIGGCEVYAFAQNSDVCGGAMSKAQAAKIEKVYELALKTGTPVIGIYDSVGARVSQGVDMLQSYGKLLNLSGKLAGVVPQISVVLGPCEGTAALLASEADFVIQSEQGKFTVKTNGDGGSADDNMKHGVIAVKSPDESSALQTAKELVSMLPRNNLSDAFEIDIPAPVPSSDLISEFADGGSFIELYEGSSQNIKTGFVRIDGRTVGVVSTSGEIDRRCAEKTAKMVRFCDAFSIPVVTLADSTGFRCIKSAAKLTAAYAEATTAKITVVTGQAYGAFYMAAAGTGASTDVTFALENACVSPVNPEAGMIILAPEKLKTDKAGREKALEEFKKEQCSALKAAQQGFIDSVLTKDELRSALVGALTMLSGKREATLPKKHSTL